MKKEQTTRFATLSLEEVDAIVVSMNDYFMAYVDKSYNDWHKSHMTLMTDFLNKKVEFAKKLDKYTITIDMLDIDTCFLSPIYYARGYIMTEFDKEVPKAKTYEMAKAAMKRLRASQIFAHQISWTMYHSRYTHSPNQIMLARLIDFNICSSHIFLFDNKTVYVPDQDEILRIVEQLTIRLTLEPDLPCYIYSARRFFINAWYRLAKNEGFMGKELYFKNKNQFLEYIKADLKEVVKCVIED